MNGIAYGHGILSIYYTIGFYIDASIITTGKYYLQLITFYNLQHSE